MQIIEYTGGKILLLEKKTKKKHILKINLIKHRVNTQNQIRITK